MFASKVTLSAKPSATTSRKLHACAPAKLYSRRQLYGMSAAIAPLMFTGAASALIAYDDDEEMVEKAKANRAKRLKEDIEANRRYVDSSGIRDRSVEQSLLPVQNAVYKLAKAGEELSKSDTKAAAQTLSADWVLSFASAGKAIASTPDTTAQVDKILGDIKSAAIAANSGQVKEAKTAYVSAVLAVEGWAAEAGVAGQLKGL